MTTILGERINLIRPSLIKSPRIPKTLWKPRQINSKRAKIGQVALIALRLIDGSVKAATVACHAELLNLFKINPDSVQTTGWIMKDGREIWR